ncbi:MAG: PKD domain-containing protein, partial [Candidatus Thorarchaeota archaeon]
MKYPLILLILISVFKTYSQEVGQYEVQTDSIIITESNYISQSKNILKSLMDVPHIRQCGQTYSSDQLGFCTSETICSAGCALCSMCMLLEAHDIDVDPDDLNDYLKTQTYGYARYDQATGTYIYDQSGCLINWSTACGYSTSTVSYSGSSVLSLNILRDQIDAGNPVIACVSNGGHFVIISGYNNDGSQINDFIVDDPGRADGSNRNWNNYHNNCTGLRLFNNVDYTWYRVSGIVVDLDNNPINEVRLTFSNNGGFWNTNDVGSYSKTMRTDWTGTVTPSKTDFVFSPSSRVYTIFNSDQTNQDYIGSLIAPTGLSVTPSTQNQEFNIVWNSVGSATHYKILRSLTNDINSATDLSNWQTNTNYTDNTIEPNTDYYYWVISAINNAGGCRTDLNNCTSVHGNYFIPVVIADFDFSINENTVDFINMSTGNIVSYEWDFGDNNTSEEENPSHTYSSTGIYTVILTITDNSGNKDTKEVEINNLTADEIKLINSKPFVMKVRMYKLGIVNDKLVYYNGYNLQNGYLVLNEFINETQYQGGLPKYQIIIQFNKIMENVEIHFSHCQDYYFTSEIIHGKTQTKAYIYIDGCNLTAGCNENWLYFDGTCSDDEKRKLLISGQDEDGNNLIHVKGWNRSISLSDLSQFVSTEEPETGYYIPMQALGGCLENSNEEGDMSNPDFNNSNPVSHDEFIGGDDWEGAGENDGYQWNPAEIECENNLNISFSVSPETPSDGDWTILTAKANGIGFTYTWEVDEQYSWSTFFQSTKQGFMEGTHHICLTAHGVNGITNNYVCGTFCDDIVVTALPKVQPKFSFLNGCRAVKIGTPTKILDESWIRENQTSLCITWRDQMNLDRQEHCFSQNELHSDGIYSFNYQNYGHTWQKIKFSTNTNEEIPKKLAYSVDCSKQVTTNNWSGALYHPTWNTRIYSGDFELSNLNDMVDPDESHILSACNEIRLLPGFTYTPTSTRTLTLEAGQICDNDDYIKSAEEIYYQLPENEYPD